MFDILFQLNCPKDMCIKDTQAASYLTSSRPVDTKLLDHWKTYYQNNWSTNYQNYMITITFCKKKKAYNFRKIRFEDSKTRVVQYFERYFLKYLKKERVKYLLIPEYTQSGDLHYHGIIQYRDYEQFNKIKRYIGRNMGFQRHDQIESFTKPYKLEKGEGSFEKVWKYIWKDKDKMDYKLTGYYRTCVPS